MVLSAFPVPLSVPTDLRNGLFALRVSFWKDDLLGLMLFVMDAAFMESASISPSFALLLFFTTSLLCCGPFLYM